MDKIILNATDYVGMSFWVISLALIAATFFFYVERDRATGVWKTTLSLAAIMTGIAAINYHFIRDIWLISGYSPTAYRYIEWLLTGPIQILAIYLFVSANHNIKSDLVGRLFIAAVIMWLAGYLGEIHYLDENVLWGCFCIHVIAWLYILYELFAGETAIIIANQSNLTIGRTYRGICLIILFGWAVYPFGYWYQYGYDGNLMSLNILYNLAEFFNKIVFGLLIWLAATKEHS